MTQGRLKSGANPLSSTVHEVLDDTVACKPDGIAASSRIFETTDEVTCKRCLKVLGGTAIIRYDQPDPIPEATGDYLVEPYGGGTTVNDLFEMLSEHLAALDTTRPIRCLGRFQTGATVAFMVSEHGDLVVMCSD